MRLPLLLLLHTAWAGTVTLDVGVHVEAGTIRDVAVDGAAGQCRLGPSWISCPATGPVVFRWGPDGPWSLQGDTVLQPDTTGVAWVLADPAVLSAGTRDLPEPVTAEAIRDRFVRYGTHHPPPPSLDLLRELPELAHHPDPLVRRAVADAIHPWIDRSSLSPLPPTAPVPLPDGLLTTLSRDPDIGVRARMASNLRDIRRCHLTDEALDVRDHLLRDHVKRVRRAAMGSSAALVSVELLPGQEAWLQALRQVRQPGPPGRVAANTFARLAQTVEPGGPVDPEQALARTLTYHRERTWRVWTAWRREIPIHRGWSFVLLRETVGVAPRLLRYWAEHEPELAAEIFTEWEPSPPHSDRFQVVQRSLSDIEHPAIRRALALDTAPPPPLGRPETSPDPIEDP